MLFGLNVSDSAIPLSRQPEVRERLLQNSGETNGFAGNLIYAFSSNLLWFNSAFS